jgi:hypothetical protein
MDVRDAWPPTHEASRISVPGRLEEFLNIAEQGAFDFVLMVKFQELFTP